MKHSLEVGQVQEVRVVVEARLASGRDLADVLRLVAAGMKVVLPADVEVSRLVVRGSGGFPE